MKKASTVSAIVFTVLFLSTGMHAQVVMNEIFSRGSTGNLDWIELYNAGSSTVDISTYKIYDSGGQGGTKPKKPFPSGATIPAKGYYVIVTDTAHTVGDLSGFGLSNSGEKVWLEDSTTGSIVDSTTYGATATTSQSIGRTPDGGAWGLLNTITRGATNGGSTSVTTDGGIATDFALTQNYPNPFNPSTTIRFSVARESTVRLTVFNLLGQPVATLADQLMNPGSYNVVFEASHLPSGVYVYRLDAGSTQLTKTMMLLK